MHAAVVTRQLVHNRSGRYSSDKRRNRNSGRAKNRDVENNNQGGTNACTAGHANDTRFCQRVSKNRLHQRAADAQRGSHQQSQH